jgi:hypothetical protein
MRESGQRILGIDKMPPVSSCFLISINILIRGKILGGTVLRSFFNSDIDSLTVISLGEAIM